MKFASTFKTSSVVAGVLIAGLALTGCSGNNDTKPTSISTKAELPAEFQKAQKDSAKTLSSFLKSVQKSDKTKMSEALGTPGLSPEQQLANIKKAYPELSSYVTTDGSAQQQVAFLQMWLTSPILGNEEAKVSVNESKLQAMNEDNVQVNPDAIVIKNLNTAFSTPPIQLIEKDGKWFVSN